MKNISYISYIIVLSVALLWPSLALSADPPTGASGASEAQGDTTESLGDTSGPSDAPRPPSETPEEATETPRDGGAVDGSPEPASPAESLGDTPDGPSFGEVGELVQAVKDGDWREVVALGLIFLVAGLMWLSRKSSWAEGQLEKDWVSVLFTFGTSFAGAVGSALLTDVAVDWSLFKASLAVAMFATGGYAVLWKKLALPLIDKVRGK